MGPAACVSHHSRACHLPAQCCSCLDDACGHCRCMALPFFFGLFRFVGLPVRRPCPVIILACLEAAWLLRHDGALHVRAVMAVSSHLYAIFLSCAAYGLLPFITDLPQMPKCGPNLTSRIRSTLHSRRLHYVVPTCTKFCRRLGPLLTLSITLPCLILCALQATNPHRSYDHMRITCRRGVSAPIFLVMYTTAVFHHL